MTAALSTAEDWVASGEAMPVAFDPALTALSFLLAFLAAHIAHEFSCQISRTTDGRARCGWLGLGIVAVGSGIWAQHFIAFLATELTIPVEYGAGELILSMISAGCAGAAILYILGRPTLRGRHLVASGAVAGAGIVGTHVATLWSMRLDLDIYRDPLLFTGSAVATILLMILAFIPTLLSGERNRDRALSPERLFSAAAMGVAISLVHFTALAADEFVPTVALPSSFRPGDVWLIAGMVGAVATCVMLLAVDASLVRRHHMDLRKLDDEAVERRRAETVAAESKLEFQAIVELVADAVISLNEDYRISVFNAAAEQMFGCSRAEVLGQTLDRLLPEAAVDRHRELVEQFAYSTAQTKYIGERSEIFARRSNGELFPVEASISRRETPNGMILTVVMRDVSARKTAEKALRDSQALLTAIVESFPGPCVVRDIKGQNILVNRAFGDWYQIDRSEVIGKQTRSYLPQEIVESTIRQEREVIETGRNVEVERRVTFPDGVTRDVFSQKFPIFDDNDSRCIAIGTTLSDISKTKEAEDALRESEERFRAVFETAPYGITLKDFDGQYLMVNDTFASWMTMPASEIAGKTPYDLYPAAFADEGRANDREVLLTGVSKITEDTRLYRDGVLRTVLTHKRAILSKDDEIIAVCTMIADITDRKISEEAQKQALSEARQANQAKTEFLASMSHELRTPLNAVLGFAEVMQKQFFGPLGSEKYLEYAEGILVSGKHLLNLVNDLLDLSRIDAGQLDLSKKEFGVWELFSECQLIVGQRAQDAGISLTVACSDDLPPLHADRQAVRQVMINLLINAIKFTPREGRITLFASVNSEDHVIEVADTGVGIAEGDIQRLANPFEKGGGNAYLAHDGAGLGLAISKSLVELHGGALEIRSDLGKGTLVTVMLPRTIDLSSAFSSSLS